MGNEWTTIFQVTQVAAYIIGACIFVVMIKSDIRVLKVEMSGISDNLKIVNRSLEKLSEILAHQAAQDQRIIHIENDIRELKHGRGFIQDAIAGEYTRRGKVSDS